jgi:hypothetical protein
LIPPPLRGGGVKFLVDVLGLPLELLGHDNQMPARRAVRRQTARQSQIVGCLFAKVRRAHANCPQLSPFNAELTKQFRELTTPAENRASVVRHSAAPKEKRPNVI